MAYRTLPPEEISQRIRRLQNLLEAEGFQGALILQKVDLYYLSGTDQDAHLWVPRSGAPLLMVRKSMERALEDAALEHIVPLSGFPQIWYSEQRRFTEVKGTQACPVCGDSTWKPFMGISLPDPVGRGQAPHPVRPQGPARAPFSPRGQG